MATENEEKIDYLEVDDTIPGQNYVCLSFISPEALIQEKEAFKAVKFLQSYCNDKKLNFQKVYDEYKDFTYKYVDNLQKDFDEQNKFQTNIRGIKVRGVYQTRDEAEKRAKKLQTIDSDFNVFVGMVGYWLPWEPNADKIEDEHFQNSQLNDMMEKYKENSINKDVFYEEQKREKVKSAREEVMKKKREAAEKLKAQALEDGELNVVQEADEPCPEDPVIESKSTGITGVAGPTGSVENKIEEIQETVGNVDEETKKILEERDPWLERKLSEKSD